MISMETMFQRRADVGRDIQFVPTEFGDLEDIVAKGCAQVLKKKKSPIVIFFWLLVSGQ